MGLLKEDELVCPQSIADDRELLLPNERARSDEPSDVPTEQARALSVASGGEAFEKAIQCGAF